ncbi:MAG TPA: DNA-3-methyladenine glycosylase [Patescibacteria group bacterium]|nr:DNA-3-methyladenine glycosylase [Patescibacteria group bacterium]
MHKKIRDHFAKVDPVLSGALELMKNEKDLGPRKNSDYFVDLCEAIINQQLSDKAAATIFGRFVLLFPKKTLLPEVLLQIPEEKIRGVGTSWSKVHFLQSLAKSVVANEIRLDSLKSLSDEEVIRELTKLKGIGPWTAEMFLMFSLGRPDVFSFGDVGLRRAIQKLYQLKKEPSDRQMKQLSKKWSPYRTYAARILWRSLDTFDDAKLQALAWKKKASLSINPEHTPGL